MERTRKYVADLRVRLAERTPMYLRYLRVRSLTYITRAIERVAKDRNTPLGGSS